MRVQVIAPADGAADAPRYTVTITVRLRDGGTVRAVRRYRTCAR
jgi:hypothetical protein